MAFFLLQVDTALEIAKEANPYGTLVWGLFAVVGYVATVFIWRRYVVIQDKMTELAQDMTVSLKDLTNVLGVVDQRSGKDDGEMKRILTELNQNVMTQNARIDEVLKLSRK